MTHLMILTSKICELYLTQLKSLPVLGCKTSYNCKLLCHSYNYHKTKPKTMSFFECDLLKGKSNILTYRCFNMQSAVCPL